MSLTVPLALASWMALSRLMNHCSAFSYYSQKYTIRHKQTRDEMRAQCGITRGSCLSRLALCLTVICSRTLKSLPIVHMMFMVARSPRVPAA